MRSGEFFGWLSALAALFLGAGCGSGDKPANGDPSGAGGSVSGGPGAAAGDRAAANESTVELTLDGPREDQLLRGGARLEVRELNPVVNLAVTTVFDVNHDDLVELHLALDGVENAMGFHRAEFGSAANNPALAVAYLELVSYSSQSGTLEVTLKNDRSIEGRFDAVLSQDAPLGSDPALVPPPIDDFEISGTFSGTWSLLCRSPVIGLPGDHSVADSPYCNNLTF
jgi:hypothetical protein